MRERARWAQAQGYRAQKWFFRHGPGSGAEGLARRIGDYRPRWLEECAMPDRIDTYRRIRDSIAIPLAGGEHEYTRWGFKRFIDAGALDVLQPDIYWAGGLSETLKIAALATASDLTLIPHDHSTPAGVHFAATQFL